MDRDRIEAFLDQFLAFAGGATTMGLLAVADRTGMLTWLAEHGSGTVGEIAAGAGLDERYVEEIASGLAAAGVLEVADGVFTLPPEHALFLADESSPYFMGGWFDMLPTVLARVDDVAHAAIEGGGVAFEEFGPGMVRGLDRGNSASQRVFLVKRWLPAVPGLLDDLEAGIRVADVGCGSGTAARVMAEAFPASTIVGYDVAAESIDLARSRVGDLPNLTYEVASVEDLPTEPSFDLITAFDVIHDLAHPLAGLRRIREALSPDGRFLMMEPNMSSRLEENLDPVGVLNYGISSLFCMTQSLAVGGEGLGAGWGRQKAEEYAREAGFGGFEPLEAIENRFSAFYLLTK